MKLSQPGSTNGRDIAVMVVRNLLGQKYISGERSPQSAENVCWWQEILSTASASRGGWPFRTSRIF